MTMQVNLCPLHDTPGYYREMADSTFADRLRMARARAGFETPKDAVEAYGYTGSTYYQHEDGKRTPRQPTVKRYARNFRVSFTWLLTGEGDSGIPQASDSIILDDNTTATILRMFAMLGDTIHKEHNDALGDLHDIDPSNPQGHWLTMARAFKSAIQYLDEGHSISGLEGYLVAELRESAALKPALLKLSQKLSAH